MKQALKQAEVEKKPVFIDFTATTCTNCIYNDRSVFTKPEVKNQLRQYVLVHLYTDNVPEGYESSKTGKQNETLEHTVFSNAQLPLYAIVKPTGAGSEIVDRYDGSGFEIVGTYGEGAIHRVSDFTQFLQDKLPKPPSNAPRRGEGRMTPRHSRPGRTAPAPPTEKSSDRPAVRGAASSPTGASMSLTSTCSVYRPSGSRGS